MPDGRLHQRLVVLADTVPAKDGGHRAVPLWLRVYGDKELLSRLGRPAADAEVTSGLLETAVRLAGPDYSCAAADGSAVLAATVPEPAGSAVLVQAIVAEDYRGRTVTFRGQLRATGLAGQAGLHLAVSGPPHRPLGARPGHGSSLTAAGSSDWTWHEVTVPVPGEAVTIRFGISLTGRGRIELRSPELTPVPPGTQE